MPAYPIYKIGHGTRKMGELLGLLRKFAIGYLLDVRSRPYSKFNPQFNREALMSSLEVDGIRYVYMGDALGGRPADPACYTPTAKSTMSSSGSRMPSKKGSKG